MADFNAPASDSAHVTSVASATRILVVGASDSFASTDNSLPQNPSADSATFTDLALSVMDLGRFRRGDWVPLSFTVQQLPDSIPVAVILDINSVQVDAKMMPAVTPDGLTFLLPYQIGLLYEVGNFNVYFSYVLSGTPTLQNAAFEVVPGGDSGGAVISLYSIDRPEVRSIVAQLDSGVLVLGRSPTVKE